MPPPRRSTGPARNGAAPAAFLAALAAAAHAQTCTLQGFQPGAPRASATAAALFDDLHTGRPRLYVTGALDRLGPVASQSIARWDGQGWAPIPGAPGAPGAPAGLGAMTVHRDAQGPALIVATTDEAYGGQPAHRIWSYDGAAWTELPPLSISPIDGRSVIGALASFDPDGPGPAPARLFASAFVEDYLPHSIEYFARVFALDGGSWTEIGAASVGPLIVFDPDGAGPAPAQLYIPGTVGSADIISLSETGRIYRLEGSALQEIAQAFRAVRTGTLHDPDGPGPLPPRLIVGGGFDSIRVGGVTVPAQRIAAFDGTSWSALGSGIPGTAGDVTALASLDAAAPQPPLLVAGGSFRQSDGAPADGLASWNGLAWTTFAGGARALPPGTTPRVDLLRPFDNAPGPAAPSLLLSSAAIVSNQVAPRIAIWRSGAWQNLLDGPVGPVNALTTFNGGEGGATRLFAAGSFFRCGPLTVNGIAAWDGKRWDALGSGIEPVAAQPNPEVFATAVFNDGSGWKLYAAGTFASAGGLSLRNIARWNGSAWERVGGYGLSGGYVYALTVHDPDGPGPLPARLYAGGFFTLGDSTPTQHLASWNGSAWAPVSGFQQDPGAAVRALRSWDDGSGPALWVGGDPMSAPGLPQNFALKLTAAGWQALPSLLGSIPGERVNAFAFHDLGAGYRIYAIGNHGQGFAARLEGGSWVAVVPPVQVPWRLPQFVARSVNDGAGPALLIGDLRYDGAWSLVQPGIPSSQVRAMTQVYDDGNGPAIFYGGDFGLLGQGATADPVPFLARFPVCTPCYPNCDQSATPPLLNVADFTCFLQKFATADPWANCDASTTPPTLNVADFTCFLQRFSAGCP